MFIMSLGSIPAFKGWEEAESSRVISCVADAALVGGYSSGAYIMHVECVSVLCTEGPDLGPDSVIINELAICIYVVRGCGYIAG
jgi:hypothetical protein